MNEIERLRCEIAELKRALGERQQLAAPKLPALINDQTFVEDLARFADNVLTQEQVRKKYHLFDEATWERLGKDDALVERIELRRIERTRSGQTKRELAQLHIVRGPLRLASIMDDPKANARHVVDSIKALDSLTGDTPRAEAEMDRVIVTINLGANEKLTFGGAVRPTPSGGEIIDGTPDPIPGFMIEATKKDDGSGNPL